ncbi:MAG: hypothetical protein ABIV51_10290 [Saprospiraceae bacterium]
MRDSKVYISITYLNVTERNKLDKFVRSPYFNSNESIVKLYTILENDVRVKPSEDLEKAEVWSHIMGKEDYDDLRFRRLCSDLLRLVEKFLSQEVFEDNTLHQASYLMEAVSSKKMEKMYNGAIKTARRLSQQQYYKSADYYFYQYQIEKKLFIINQLDLQRREKTNLEALVDNLDQFYLAEKMRYYCDFLSRKGLTTHDYKILFMDEILNHLDKYTYEENPAISVYHQMYLTQTQTQEDTIYYKLKELLSKYGQLFPQQEADEIYGSALNYCIRRINKGDTNFSRELFELYQDLLSKEIILIDGILSPWKFRNIIISALRLGDFKWVEDFIEEYKNALPESHRENAITYNTALLYFYKKDYEKALKFLQNVEYFDVIYDLSSKSMLLAAYYELNETESLFSLFESFRMYLNRNKGTLQEKSRNMYLNLIKFVKKLVQIPKGDLPILEKLLAELDSAEGVASESWLREKVAEKMA